MSYHYYTPEDAILIIQFMEYEVVEYYPGKKIYKLPKAIIPYIGCEEFGNGDTVLQFKNEFFKYEAKFHYSWDWLIPVVAKCFKLSPVGIRMTPNFEEQYSIVMSYIKSHKK